MAIGQGFQKVAGAIGRGFHGVDIHFHTCVYTRIRIYSQDNAESPDNGAGHEYR
jgi:hypothetical protein